MNQITLSPDKFGYYQVGDFKTYSKLEALELQAVTNQFPEWNFNREVYDKLDWCTEPTADLWTLYKERCHQIRENYDYVVLFYSGGSDSANVLDAWVDSGCKLDEIATWHTLDATGDKYDVMNSEITLVVMDRIKKLQEQHIDTKHRLIDVSQWSVDMINEIDVIYAMNSIMGPHRTATTMIRTKIKEYADIVASGRKLCFVWGVDKPQLFFDGRHYVQFFDITDRAVNAIGQTKYHQGWYDEFFYWTPDFTDIIVKQSQIVKKFLDTCHDGQFYQTEFAQYGYNPTIKKYLKGKYFRGLIFPKWNVDTFTVGKHRHIFGGADPSKPIITGRDRWFWTSNLPEREKIIDQYNYMLDKIDTYWLHNLDNKYRGFKCHVSPRYYL